MAQRRAARPDADIERAYRKERAHWEGTARANEGDGGCTVFRHSHSPSSGKSLLAAKLLRVL